MVVQDDDLERRRLRVAQPLPRLRQLVVANAAGLVAPGPDRIQADDVERGGGVRRFTRLPLPLEAAERAGEARRKGVRYVVIARYRQYGAGEAVQEARGVGELILAAAMAEVSAGDDELGLKALDQNGCAALDRVVVPRSEMEIGEV